jgi:hypothetical protein
MALGNLTLDVSRRSGLYPDIFMGYPEPLRQLHQLGVIEPQARFAGVRAALGDQRPRTEE